MSSWKGLLGRLVRPANICCQEQGAANLAEQVAVEASETAETAETAKTTKTAKVARTVAPSLAVDRGNGYRAGARKGGRACLRACQRVLPFVAVALVMLLATASLGGDCQASSSIRISPSRLEKQVRRFLFWEDRSIGPIKVVNSGTSPLRVRISIEDLFQTDDGSAVFITDGSYEYGAADLVTLEPAEFVVEPGMTQLVKGVVDTSSGRKGGGYCVAFFETLPDTGDHAVMATASRIGALLYIVFPGSVEVAGSIDRLEVAPLNHEDDVGVQVRLLLHNAGDVHVCPNGILRLKTMGAVQVCDGGVSPENVLPGASRWLAGSLSLPPDIAPGQYLLEVTMLLSDARSAYAEAVLSITRDGGGAIEVSLDRWGRPAASDYVSWSR